MPDLPFKLQKKLSQRGIDNALRVLPGQNELIDFSSNDYLGLSRNAAIFHKATERLKNQKYRLNGATGSRLLSGNHELYGPLEDKLSDMHDVEASLVYNSGYDANIGFFGAVPQRGDVVIYDELIHASIRDGIKMGNAKSYKFRHNDLDDLRKVCHEWRSQSQMDQEVYVVTESVFSMDGDSPDLARFSDFCNSERCHFVVDEAHSVGIFGANGMGLVQQLGLQDNIFARIVTFGKAMGCHGAAILGSQDLIAYLVNFSRSWIYTTGLPPHAVATIQMAYEHVISPQGSVTLEQLRSNISFFGLQLESLQLKPYFIPSKSMIQCCIVTGNERAKSLAQKMQQEGFDVRAILSPTVPAGKERLRFCLHTFNTEMQIKGVLTSLSKQIQIQ